MADDRPEVRHNSEDRGTPLQTETPIPHQAASQQNGSSGWRRYVKWGALSGGLALVFVLALNWVTDALASHKVAARDVTRGLLLTPQRHSKPIP